MFCPTHCFLSKCAFCFNVLLSGLVGNSLSDWTLRCITWNVNATMSSQLLNHCISSYFSKYYSQLCLTLFEVVFRRTSGPSITPSVIPQTLTDELLSIGLGSSHQGQELYHRGFQCRAHLRLLRTVVLLDFYLNRVGVQLLEVQPPNTCSARHIPQLF